MSNAQEKCDALYEELTGVLKANLPDGCGFVIAIAGPEGDISVGMGGLPERHAIYSMMSLCIGSDILQMHASQISRETTHYEFHADDAPVAVDLNAWPFPTGPKQ